MKQTENRCIAAARRRRERSDLDSKATKYATPGKFGKYVETGFNVKCPLCREAM
jgi:hypothetical protein